MESLVTPLSAQAEHDRVVKADLDYIVESLSGEPAELAGSRILLTGGAGFLGYYLTQTILATIGTDPVVVDGRRMIAPDSVANYEGIGRTPTVSYTLELVA